MAESILAIAADQLAEINAPIDGFDGGVWTCDGRSFVVIATQTWAMRVGGGQWATAVAFQPLEPVEGEPHTYVIERSAFLAAFTAAAPTDGNP